MKKRLFLALGLVLAIAVIITQNSGLFTSTGSFVDSQIPLQINETSFDNPVKGMGQELEMTMDRNLGEVPTQRKVKAFKELKEQFSQEVATFSAIPGVQWQERGSDNVGGRTRTIMFDPNDSEAKKVWAGAIAGGLWSNEDITNAGSKWIQEDDIMSNLVISTIAYDPSNTQVFYMGTGQGFISTAIRGAGIWKSTNGGANWAQLSSSINSNFDYVQKIKVTADGIVLAATTKGLFRSPNEGSTWTRILEGQFGDIDIASDGTIYASQGVRTSDGGIFKSIDNGFTWTDITPSDNGKRTTVAASPSNPNIIYAVAALNANGGQDVAYFKKSIDAGATWTDVTIPLLMKLGVTTGCEEDTDHFTRGQASFNLTLEVHPENPDIVYAGGIDNHRSTDGGETWIAISDWTGINGCRDYAHADNHDFQIRPGHPNSLLVANDGGMDYTVDAGTAERPDFERRVNGYNTMLFYYGAMVNELGSNTMIAGTQDNGTQRFTTPGINSTNMVYGGDGGFSFIDPNNSDFWIVSNPQSNYAFSTDGGLSFTSITSSVGNTGRFINPTDMDFERGILYSAAGGNQLGRIQGFPDSPGNFNTLDLSNNGDPGIGNAQISAVKVSPYTENRVFVGTFVGSGGKIFIIDNAHLGSPTITEITGDLDENRGGYLRSIDIGASDDELLITFSNYGANSVYTTVDGGTTWINKEANLPDIPVRWGIFNPKNTKQVLLGTDLGVWSSNDITDSNPNWEPTNNGLASVRVDHLLYRSADETILATTYGRGLFTSNVFATTVKADFKTKQIVGNTGIAVNFEDASLLPGDSWSWDFGDGNSSSSQNPSHSYNNAGTYDVSLSIANGSSTETKTGYVTILPLTNVPYLAADGGDFESNPEHFTSRSLLNGLDIWERGVPGNNLMTPSSGINAWKTKLEDDITNVGYNHKSAFYTPAFNLSETAKDYTLSFRMSKELAFCNGPMAMQAEYSLDGGITWNTLGSSINEPGNANWYSSGPSLGCSLVTDIFENQMGWAASLGNNTNVLTQYKLNNLSGQANVSFRFVFVADGGFSQGYDVDGFMIDDFEILATDPLSDFESDLQLAYTGTDIQFSYLSNGADSYLWDFGDNTTSTEINPVHSYQNTGYQTVSLTTTTNGVSLTETKVDYILVLTSKTVPYTLEDGGNFDVNTTDFLVVLGDNTQFELGVSAISGKDGTASGSNAWVTGLTESVYKDDSDSRLRSPLFDLDVDQVMTLEFKAKYSFEPDWEGFIVNYSTDRGHTWTKLNNSVVEGWYTQNGDANVNAIFGPSAPIFGGNTNGEFVRFFTDVTFLAGEEVIFEFDFRTDTNTVDVGMALDDFQVLLSDPLPIAADFSIQTGTGCAGQQVVFTNTSTGTIASYAWDFGANASPATATGSGPHTVVYTAGGNSTVSLNISNAIGQSDTETKTDVVLTGDAHSPSFAEEADGDKTTARLVATAGDSYQWYKNSTAIAGATSQVYIADEVANYLVDVTINGCTIQTSQIHIITSTEEDEIFKQGVNIYPNPVKDIVNVQVSNAVLGELQIQIINMAGSTIIDKTVQKSSFDAEYKFYLSEYKSGTYLIVVTSDKGRSVKRIIKEK
jgi:PKD repeat protein